MARLADDVNPKIFSLKIKDIIIKVTMTKLSSSSSAFASFGQRLVYRRLSQLLLFSTCLWSLLQCPYSKVEESFQLQAVHDLFYYGLTPALGRAFNGNSNNETRNLLLPYDHLQYPGVVPRSFTMPLLLSTLCQVVRGVVYWIITGGAIDLAHDDAYAEVVQFLSRFLLLLLNVQAWSRLAAALDTKSTRSQQQQPSHVTGTYLLLVTACQFHIPFYASRMLPNVFAMVLTLHAMSDWMLGNVTRSARILVFTMTVIRCDVLLLLVSCGLSWLIGRQLTIFQAMRIGIMTILASLCLTVPLDSLLWQQWPMWPEGQVLYFNTILGKSSEWGVSPWYWYGVSALPRALMATLFLIPVSLMKLPPSLSLSSMVNNTRFDPTWLPYLLPAVGFVALYSCLGHKELRFLFPVLPLFNVAAAVGCTKLHELPWNAAKIQSSKDKNIGMLAHLVYGACLGALVVSLAASLVFVAVSHWNYPGGQALLELSRLVGQAQRHQQHHLHVYIDVASAMTGVSLFGQRASPARTPGVTWTFEKGGYEEEHASVENYSKFTHILSESRDLAGDENFEVIGVIQGHPRLDIKRARIVTKDAMYILQRKDLR